jgi:preprotein translocase subunit SecG
MPLWLRVSTAASLAVAATTLILAVLFSDRADRAETAIESSFTVSGWRNENAIENAVSASGEIGRSRSLARTAAATGGFFLAAAIVLMVMGARERNRKTEIMSRMASEWKEEKAAEIRGFISLHVGTLAQKRI